MELDWLTALSAVQSFRLEAFGAHFPTSWSTMTNLTHLEVFLEPQGFLVFGFDLSTLASLQDLELSFMVILSGDRLSGLANLSDLQQVHLQEVKPYDVATGTEMGLLAY